MAKLLGSGSKGRTQNPKAALAGGSASAPNEHVKLDASQTEPSATDAVQQRTNTAVAGKMLHTQLQKNKSKGMTP